MKLETKWDKRWIKNLLSETAIKVQKNRRKLLEWAKKIKILSFIGNEKDTDVGNNDQYPTINGDSVRKRDLFCLLNGLFSSTQDIAFSSLFCSLFSFFPCTGL